MKRFTLCTLLVTCLLFTGCTRPVELKNRLIVQAVGVDWVEDSFQVTVQVFRSEEGGQQAAFNVSNANSVVYQASGRTITEALSRIEEESSKRVFLGSNQVLLVGEQMAYHRMSEAVSYFNSNHAIVPRNQVVVVQGKAADLVTIEVTQGLIPADALKKSLEVSAENGTTVEGTLMGVVRAFQSPYGVTGVPFLAKAKDFEGKDTYENLGTILLNKEGIISSLDTESTRGASWIMQHIRGAILVLEHEENSFSVLARPKSPRITCEIRDGAPFFHIKLKVLCSVPEALGSERTGVAEAEVEEMKALTSAAIKKEIVAVLNECVLEKQADLFEFHQYLEKYENQWWQEHKNEWPELLSTVQASVEVKVEVRGLGLGYQNPE